MKLAISVREKRRKQSRVSGRRRHQSGWSEHKPPPLSSLLAISWVAFLIGGGGEVISAEVLAASLFSETIMKEKQTNLLAPPYIPLTKSSEATAGMFLP